MAAPLRGQQPPAESGYDLWLRYVGVEDAALRRAYASRITHLVVQGASPSLRAAAGELERGIRGLLGAGVPVEAEVRGQGALVVGTPASSAIVRHLGWGRELDALGPEGFVIRSTRVADRPVTIIASSGDAGALYGAFHLLRLLQTGRPIDTLRVAERPRLARRMLDHWDNLDGTIERGYAGASIWRWAELPARIDPRLVDYARANASIGINGVVLNNVNADPRVLRADYLAKVAAIASALRPYNVRVYLSANFGAPLPPSSTPDAMKKWGGIGSLPTADPLDPRVARWWREKADEIYRLIPDFGGFLVKASSEGMPGPQDYGRSHVDGANMLAAALAPHGGVVMWRAFVYPKNADPDRVKRGYKEFVPLDGRFAANVFVQPKNGPLDFQPREPFNPLFGAMPDTPLMPELQITQEYLGRATHLVYLAPMWKEFLDADTHARGAGSTVARIVERAPNGTSGMTGIAGVANVGADSDWTGHHFAQANWYAFGRLAWDPSLPSDAVAEEWARMTWSNRPRVVRTVESMMLGSWEAAVSDMTPLGLSLTVDGQHYDPGLERREGEYWHADSLGIGYDRSSRGSDYVGQYHEPLRRLWDEPATTPPELLLWFHRVSWDFRLPNGRTVWAELVHRYDDGARYGDDLLASWRTLAGDVDARRWREVQDRLEQQRAHALRWRDASVAYFGCRSGRTRCGG
ncbi:Glycosyl hydrolase 67 middle domain protein (plasmid) [Gemmatirosa kalamazoonensis]|uniref:Xylan alpha-1,2-glucuronidase n=2 Tax=Gemmatirosa kalamazoonensis TaxID=861299 RepID=W0RQB1_9BACT|nr:Glycosyl hydrolase 67 middle domain protein [Gemmatirosa kalamazoonensis]